MKRNFKLALLTMATLGAFSCSSDKLAEDGTQNPSQDGAADGFISFKINNVGSGMRASSFTDGSYAAGTEDEYAITTEQGANVVFFFDNTGSSFGKSYLQLMSTAEASDDGHDDTNEKVYSARIRKSQDNSGKKLASCVLILNADPANLESLSAMSWSELQEQLDNGLGQYDDYFTMSNTIYVNESSDNKIEGPAAITDDNICDTWAEAQENPVTVHVERVVAKFGVSFNSQNTETSILTNNVLTISDSEKQHPLIKYNAGTQQFEDSKTKTWGVRITNWDVNAKETQTYYVKNLSTGSNITDGKLSGDGSFGKWSLTYGENNKGWNDQSRVRSYWAVDPHYNSKTDVYPEQYRTAENEKGVVSGANSSNTALTYISYNDIQKGITDVTYAPENTFGKIDDIIEGLEDETYEFQGEGYKRVGTHILIAAELLFDDEVGGDGTTVADKYCYEGQYWTSTDAGENQVNLIKYMVKSLTDTYGTSLYTKQAEGEVYNPIAADELAQKFSLVKATVKGGDGRLMLKLDESTTLYKKVKSGQTDTYPPVNSELQDLIYEIGTVKHFSGGKMYYPVPIEHMNANVTVDKVHKWLTGSYGVVRNHWYKVNVSAISKPGTSVDDPDQPIIPNDEPDEGEYIAFEIVVVPWHVIEQDVIF